MRNIKQAAEKGFTIQTEPTYTGNVKAGLRFNLGKGRLGQVSSVEAEGKVTA